MIIRTIGLVALFVGLGGIMSIGLELIRRAENRRKQIVKIGADLARPQGFLTLYQHDQAAVRLLERIIGQDEIVPVLREEDRAEAQRLVRAFYDDKGDRG